MPTWTLDRAPHEDAAGTLFAITVAFKVRPESYPRFLALICENAAISVAAEPGCRRFDVLTPAGGGDAATVFLYEIYDDRRAFEAHLQSAHYKAFDAASRDLVLEKSIGEFAVREAAK